MMYFIQFCVFLAVTWSRIYYGWNETVNHNGLAVGVVALLAAAVVTGVIDEIQQLPARLTRLHSRIFGLSDEPSRDITSLPRSSWHGSDTLEKRDRLRIGKDIG